MNKVQEIEGKLALGYLLRMSFVFGAFSGLIFIPLYISQQTHPIGIGEIVTVVLAAPLANGIVVMLYALAGYPVYSYFAKRKKFSLGTVKVEAG